MVTVVEEKERALQLAGSGNLGKTISPLCPPGPLCPPSQVNSTGSCSLYGPPNPAPSSGSHTSYSACNPTLPERAPVFLLSSSSVHQTSLAEFKSEQVEVEEPRDHHVITEKGFYSSYKTQNGNIITHSNQVQGAASKKSGDVLLRLKRWRLRKVADAMHCIAMTLQ